jgi:hypothetical protein
MKNKKYIILVMFLGLLLPALVLAQPDIGIEYAEDLGLAASDEDPRNVLVNIVKYLMTFLAIIAVVVILLGGFRWMTSLGNEDRLAMAKATITSGVIGLAVILVSYALVNFVINAATTVLAEGDIL